MLYGDAGHPLDLHGHHAPLAVVPHFTLVCGHIQIASACDLQPVRTRVALMKDTLNKVTIVFKKICYTMLISCTVLASQREQLVLVISVTTTQKYNALI